MVSTMFSKLQEYKNPTDLIEKIVKKGNKEDYQKKFDERTHAHIDRVNKYAKKINKEYPHHDEDKFNDLYDGYSLMSKETVTDEEQKLIDDATYKHVLNNEHHCEHWVDPKDIEGFSRKNPTPHGCLDCSKMPKSALEEMCCDWCAMSEEFHNTPFEWYEKNKDTRWHFNEEQDKFILDTLHKLWDTEDLQETDNGRIVEKIVKKGNKWQVQSEKGRNMGTYDTKEEAEKRLKQIEYFKHLKESLSESYKNTVSNGITKPTKTIAHEENSRLNEELLLELNRGQLINKSKASDHYTSKGREHENRWTRRNKSHIATRVDQYNKIDMNDFFKNDELKVGINVHGETDDYVVLIRYNGALREIAEQIKRNNNKLEFKCVLVALQRVFNSGNVFVSCQCGDWKYRQAYHGTRDGYNSGTPELRASDITNPNDTKGAGCKHVNLVLGNVDWLMKVSSVINNYIHYMKEHFERKYADLIFPKLFGMPYEKAVQLNLFDTDDTLQSDEDEIKLSNRYGRERTRFKPKSGVNNEKGPTLERDPNKPTLDLNMTRKEEEVKDGLGVEETEEIKEVE